eukprot:GHVT01022499.1.p1 GENE.GHVT01022499.1~~GHVT01022499.1.p1  ORF type:complete len:101 (-),score=11.54 GHVT01022499.1:63-365(-)
MFWPPLCSSKLYNCAGVGAWLLSKITYSSGSSSRLGSTRAWRKEEGEEERAEVGKAAGTKSNLRKIGPEQHKSTQKDKRSKLPKPRNADVINATAIPSPA